jgi:hypothetical protein
MVSNYGLMERESKKKRRQNGTDTRRKCVSDEMDEVHRQNLPMANKYICILLQEANNNF